MQKYSAAYWGTTFVAEMTRISDAENEDSNLGKAAHAEADQADIAGKTTIVPSAPNGPCGKGYDTTELVTTIL